MSDPVYSIIDIETTGGHRYGNRIIEIAIVNYRDGRVIEEYETLIHPERFIPVSISYFTGITNEMVQDAPKFHQVAKKIVEMTTDTIFVAHNVYFDFNFIKSEFASFGYVFKRPKLCTVRLARRILPGYRSYSLGKLCADLGIEIKNRHRAMGDAAATVKLLEMMLAKKPDLHSATQEFEVKKILLPPNVTREEYDKLPNTPGVYYFWDDKDNLLYVGKSKDIKKRIASHFRIDIQSAKEREMKGAIHHITFDLTGNDLCAKLLECHQIKHLRPQFNRSMRKIGFPFAVSWTFDIAGFLKPLITKMEMSGADEPEHAGVVIRANNKPAALKKISRIYDQAFGLDNDSIFFEEEIFKFKNSLSADFNERILEIIRRYDYPMKSFHIVQRGREKNESAFVMIENGKLMRIDYFNDEGCTHSIALHEDQDMKEVLIKHIRVSRVALKPNIDKVSGQMEPNVEEFFHDAKHSSF